jgi:DNA-binding PucR family transcriptional regulator
VLVDVDAQVFAVVGQRAGPGGWPWLRDIAESSPGALGASRVTTGSSGLAAARMEAVDTLAAARDLGHRCATHEEVWDTIVLSRAAAAAQAVPQSELQRLRDADRLEGTELASTVRVWLDNWGDVNSAAVTLNVHPNTVRLRMKKAERIMGGNLDTPGKRVAALLLLHDCGR